MAITTWTIAQGVPPRQHQPKPVPKQVVDKVVDTPEEEIVDGGTGTEPGSDEWDVSNDPTEINWGWLIPRMMDWMTINTVPTWRNCPSKMNLPLISSQ